MSETEYIPAAVARLALDKLQDVATLMECIHPKPHDLDPAYLAYRKTAELCILLHQALRPCGDQPWDDPSRSPEDRAAWIEAGPESLPDLGKVSNA